MGQNVTDIETRLRHTDHQALRLWLRLLACTNLIEGHIRQALAKQFDTTLPRFDFLSQLERVDSGLTMSELSERMMVTGGNVTGIAKVLEADGLIKRESDSQDRRVYRVKLTQRGREQFEKMADAHEGWIIDLFSSLDETEQGLLGDLLKSVKGNVLSHTNNKTQDQES